MSAGKIVQLDPEELEVLWAALSYYLDTLTKCSTHDEGEHGDERDCEGWGPKELKVLEKAVEKVT
jgi:hypothetical protein